jgi:hypothetical protein
MLDSVRPPRPTRPARWSVLAWFALSASAAAGPPAAQVQDVREGLAVELDREIRVGAPLAGGGRTLAVLGDLDDDLHSDVAVGAPDLLSGRSGTVLIVSTRRGRILAEVVGAEAGDAFGAALATAPDLDGDGVPELLIGAPHSNAEGELRGRVYVYSPGSERLLGSRPGRADRDEFGSALAVLGEIYGDGKTIVGVGAPGHDFNRGRLEHYELRWFSEREELRWTSRGQVTGVSSQSRFAASVASTGDVNGDGTPDYLVGAPKQDAKRLPDAGMVTLVSGASGNALRRFTGKEPGGLLGECVAGVGDVDGDGAPDFLISAPSARHGDLGDVGQVWLHSGRDHEVLGQWNGARPGDFFGRSLGGGTDLNADGVPEFWIAAPYGGDYEDPALRRGRVQVFDGAGRERLFSLQGEQPGQLLGFAALLSGDAREPQRGATFLCGAPGRRDEPTEEELESKRAGLLHVYRVRWSPTDESQRDPGE